MSHVLVPPLASAMKTSALADSTGAISALNGKVFPKSLLMPSMAGVKFRDPGVERRLQLALFGGEAEARLSERPEHRRAEAKRGAASKEFATVILAV